MAYNLLFRFKGRGEGQREGSRDWRRKRGLIQPLRKVNEMKTRNLSLESCRSTAKRAREKRAPQIITSFCPCCYCPSSSYSSLSISSEVTSSSCVSSSEARVSSPCFSSSSSSLCFAPYTSVILSSSRRRSCSFCHGPFYSSTSLSSSPSPPSSFSSLRPRGLRTLSSSFPYSRSLSHSSCHQSVRGFLSSLSLSNPRPISPSISPFSSPSSSSSLSPSFFSLSSPASSLPVFKATWRMTCNCPRSHSYGLFLSSSLNAPSSTIFTYHSSDLLSPLSPCNLQLYTAWHLSHLSPHLLSPVVFLSSFNSRWNAFPLTCLRRFYASSLVRKQADSKYRRLKEDSDTQIGTVPTRSIREDEKQQAQSPYVSRDGEISSKASSDTNDGIKPREDKVLSFFSEMNEEVVEEEQHTIPSRLAGSFAASSSSLPEDIHEEDPLHLLDEAEQEDRVALASSVQTAMQRLCRLAYSMKGESVPLKREAKRSGSRVRRLQGALDQEKDEAANGCGDNLEEKESEGKKENWRMINTKKRKRDPTSAVKDLKRTHMRSQFGWISSFVDMHHIMETNPQFNEAVRVLAAMECPIIIRTRKLDRQLIPLSHGSSARIREAAKRLREDLGISELLTCRGCAKKSKCTRYRQPALHCPTAETAPSSTRLSNTIDLLYLLLGQHMVCRLYTRGVDSKTPLWGDDEDERMAHSKMLSVSLLPSTMTERDLQMGLLVIETITKIIQEKQGEERERRQRLMGARRNPSSGSAEEEVKFNPLSVKTFREFIRQGQERQSDIRRKLREARALKMPAWIRESVCPLPDTRLTKFQRRQVQQHRLALDEPEADCPLEESFMWVQEPDEPPPSDEQGEERMKTAEEERAEQALVAAEKQQEKKMLSVPNKQAISILGQGDHENAVPALPSLEDLPIQRRFSWRAPGNFCLRQKVLRFNLLYHYYLDRLKEQASRIRSFDVSPAAPSDTSATGASLSHSSISFSESTQLNPEDETTLLPAPHGGYSAVPLSVLADDKDVHPLMRVDTKALKGVAVYGHLSVRQLVETQRRVDRLWHTAGLFDDMIHRITEEEELTPQSSAGPSSPPMQRLHAHARAQLREFERQREELRLGGSERGPGWMLPPPDRQKLLSSSSPSSLGNLEDTCAQEMPDVSSVPSDDRLKQKKDLVIDNLLRRPQLDCDKKEGRKKACTERRGTEQQTSLSEESNVSSFKSTRFLEKQRLWEIQSTDVVSPAASSSAAEGESERGRKKEEDNTTDQRAIIPSTLDSSLKEEKDVDLPRKRDSKGIQNLRDIPLAWLSSLPPSGSADEGVRLSNVDGASEMQEMCVERQREEEEVRQGEEEDDDVFEEAVFGEERKQQKFMWREAKRFDVASQERRRREVQETVETPDTVEEVERQARSFERAKAQGVSRTGGRGRRRLLGDLLEDADEDQKRFERWKAVRQRQLEEERGREEEDEEEEAEQEEDFHMAEGGGSFVTGKTNTLRFAKTSYRVVDSPTQEPLASSSLPLLSHLDMHSQTGFDSQAADDGRALQELEGLEDTGSWKEILVRPGRLDRGEKRKCRGENEGITSRRADCVYTEANNVIRRMAAKDITKPGEDPALRSSFMPSVELSADVDQRASSDLCTDSVDVQNKDRDRAEEETHQGMASPVYPDEKRDLTADTRKEKQKQRLHFRHDSQTGDLKRQEEIQIPERKNEFSSLLHQLEGGEGKDGTVLQPEIGRRKKRKDYQRSLKEQLQTSSQREDEEYDPEQTGGDDYAAPIRGEVGRGHEPREKQEQGKEYDEEEAVFQAHFRVGLESEGGRPLGLDREEILQNHLEQSKLQKSWNQNEDYLLTSNILYPKFVDLSQNAYSAHSKEGRTLRKKQVAINRSQTVPNKPGNPTRHMPLSGLLQASLPDLRDFMKKESSIHPCGDKEDREERRARKRHENYWGDEIKREESNGGKTGRLDKCKEKEKEKDEFMEKYGVVRDMEEVYREQVIKKGGLVVKPTETERQRSEALHDHLLRKAQSKQRKKEQKGKILSKEKRDKKKKTKESKIDEILRRCGSSVQF